MKLPGLSILYCTGVQRSKINRSLVPALAQQDLSQDESHGVLFSLQCVSVSMDVC